MLGAYYKPVRTYGAADLPPVTILDMSSGGNTPPSSGNATRMLLICGLLIVLGLLAAGVVLGVAGWSTESIVGLLTAIGSISVGLLVAVGKLGSVKDTVEQVAHQTNGQLRQHITDTVRREVRSALRDYGAPPPAGPQQPAQRTKPRR